MVYSAKDGTHADMHASTRVMTCGWPSPWDKYRFVTSSGHSTAQHSNRDGRKVAKEHKGTSDAKGWQRGREHQMNEREREREQEPSERNNSSTQHPCVKLNMASLGPAEGTMTIQARDGWSYVARCGKRHNRRRVACLSLLRKPSQETLPAGRGGNK